MRIFTLLLGLSALMACTDAAFDEARARQEILELEKEQRRVHFEADAASFADMLAEPHLSVNRGVVGFSERSENYERFSAYFNSVDFVEWDDLAEPIIRFSADGSLAYCVVQRRVSVRYPSDEGLYFGTTDFAWTAIYRRRANGWEIESVSSTNAEPSTAYLLNIEARADCISPEGPYQTYLLADHQGGLEFRQSYSYREGAFAARLNGYDEGYLLNGDEQSGEALEPSVINMLQGHNFFWMYLQPQLFFDLSIQDPQQATGTDALGYSVTVKRDEEHYQIQEILLRNPMDTTELIEIHYEEFDSTAFGPMPLALSIVQAQKDTFHFRFTSVNFNVEQQ